MNAADLIPLFYLAVGTVVLLIIWVVALIKRRRAAKQASK